jgi:hypothetical protein
LKLDFDGVNNFEKHKKILNICKKFSYHHSDGYKEGEFFMKKHLLGFALFSFIVGTAIFIYAMLNIVNIEEVTAPNYSPNYYSKATSCWKMKHESNRTNFGSPVVEQAIFNTKSKVLNWVLNTSNSDTSVALNFFVKDENGTRYVNSIFVPAAAYRDGLVRATSSYEWLDNLGSYDNLYVIAEPISFGERGKYNLPMKFDANRATPVLLY